MIQTERLHIRYMTEADANLMLGILTDPAFIKYVGDRGVRDQQQAAEYIQERVLPSYQQHGFGMYRVGRRVDDQAVGICGLVKRDTLPGVDVGFGFLPEFCRQGYAYEAAVAVLEYAQTVLLLPEVLAIVSPDNKASIGLLKKLAFEYQQDHCLEKDDVVQLYKLPLIN